MWRIFFCIVVLRVNGNLNGNYIELKGNGNENLLLKNANDEVNVKTKSLSLREIKEREKVLNKIKNLESSTSRFLFKKEGNGFHPADFSGKGLSYKLKYKTTLKFLLKSFLIMKTFMYIIFSIGIIASKIISWKAFTLSFMAFMFAKILMLKNLFSGSNTLSMPSKNFIPPVFVQNLPHDVSWKHQGVLQTTYQ